MSFAYEPFLLEGGPLNGQSIEIVHEDVLHPSTSHINLEAGTYQNQGRDAEGRKIMRWVEA